MDIRPIKSEDDHRQALAEIDRLFDAEPDTAEGDRLAVLVTLVDAYESQRTPIPPPDPVEAILYHLESRGLSRKDLEPYIGNRGRVSEVLSWKRALTLEMIRRLHDGLGISAHLLIQPYDLRSAA